MSTNGDALLAQQEARPSKRSGHGGEVPPVPGSVDELERQYIAKLISMVDHEGKPDLELMQRIETLLREKRTASTT
jgi:hypothetical protein